MERRVGVKQIASDVPGSPLVVRHDILHLFIESKLVEWCDMVAATSGFSVNVFIPSGQTKGLWIIEKSNWSGVGLKFPRDHFNSDIKNRQELRAPGVYILWGPDELDDAGRIQVYIGEADDLSERLSNHVTQDNRQFWQQTMVFTSKDMNLNKAHVLYLESRLIRIAKSHQNVVGYKMDQNDRNEPNLAERELSYAREFLEALLLCLPIAGVLFFEELPPDSQQPTDGGSETMLGKDAANQTFFLKGGSSGPTSVVQAEGYINGAEFVVLAGAKAAKEEADSIPSHIRENRARLIEEGHFVNKQDHYELNDAFPFGSPSAASGALLGRSSNGRNEWKTRDGRSFNDEMAKSLEGG